MSRDSDERISLSDVDVLDETDLQAVSTPSSTPPPPPPEAVQHVVVPRLAPLPSDSLAPPKIPSEPPEPEVTATREPRGGRTASGGEPRPKGRRRRGSPAPTHAAEDADDADDRDVVDIRWVLAAAVLFAVGIGTWTLARRDRPRPAAGADDSRVVLTLTGVPDHARIELDGREVRDEDLTVRSGVRHAVEVQVEGHEPWRQVFITRGELELVVQLGEPRRSTPAAPDEPALPVAAPVVADAEVDTAGAAQADAPPDPPPPAPPEPAADARPTAPTTPRTTASASTAPSTMAASMSSTTTGSSSAAGTGSRSSARTGRRGSHTLVRDPGF